MNYQTTSLTLIELAKLGRDKSWEDLQCLYLPLIYDWLVQKNTERRHHQEIVLNVFETVFIQLPKFDHNGRKGAFRNWIRQITNSEIVNVYRANQKQPIPIPYIEDTQTPLTVEANRKEVELLYAQAVEMLRQEFSPRDVEIFMRLTENNEEAKQIAKEFGLTTGNVYKIKSSIKARLRERFEGGLD